MISRTATHPRPQEDSAGKEPLAMQAGGQRHWELTISPPFGTQTEFVHFLHSHLVLCTRFSCSPNPSVLVKQQKPR